MLADHQQRIAHHGRPIDQSRLLSQLDPGAGDEGCPDLAPSPVDFRTPSCSSLRNNRLTIAQQFIALTKRPVKPPPSDEVIQALVSRFERERILQLISTSPSLQDLRSSYPSLVAASPLVA